MLGASNYATFFFRDYFMQCFEADILENLLFQRIHIYQPKKWNGLNLSTKKEVFSYFHFFVGVDMIHSIHLPPFCFGEGGRRWAPYQISKRGRELDRISILRGRLVEKRRRPFSWRGGGCSFVIKNKVKSERINDKNKNVFLCHN